MGKKKKSEKPADDEAIIGAKAPAKNSGSRGSGACAQGKSYLQVVIETAQDYIDGLDPDDMPKPSEAEGELVGRTVAAINVHNAHEPREKRWALPQYLSYVVIAMLLRVISLVCLVEVIPNDRHSRVVAVYDPRTGNHELGEEAVNAAMNAYRGDLTDSARKAILKYVRQQCADAGEVKHLYRGRRYLRHHDGWFDSETGQNIPHTPDLVAIYRPSEAVDLNAELPVFVAEDGYEWDIELCFLELADGDEDVRDLLWMGVAATAMPHLPWYQFFALIGESGNNGKGMYVDFLTAFICPENVKALSIMEFSGSYNLGGIERTPLIVGHENNTKSCVKAPESFKACVTQNIGRSEIKYEQPYNTQFMGFIVQCFNRRPVVADTSESWLRRILPIRFKHCYTGIERKYIANVWIVDPRTIRYAMRKVAEMMMEGKVTGDFPMPAAVKQELRAFDQYNSPIVNFALEVLPRLTLGVLPKDLVYDIYTAWLSEDEKSRNPMGKNKWWDEFKDVVRRYGKSLGFTCWESDNPKKRKRIPAGEFDKDEPLLSEFALSGWVDYTIGAYGMRYGTKLKVELKAKGKKYGALLVRVVPSPEDDGADNPATSDDDGCVLDDPDVGGEFLRDEYEAYLRAFDQMQAEMQAGSIEVKRTSAHGMFRGWMHGGKWCVSRYHPSSGEWYAVEYDEKPSDADEPLQYGSWLQHRVQCMNSQNRAGYRCELVELAIGESDTGRKGNQDGIA